MLAIYGKTMVILVGALGSAGEEPAASITAEFDARVVEPDRVPDAVTDRVDGCVLHREQAADRSIPALLRDIPETLPTIVVADAAELSPRSVFENGAEAFVDATGQDVGMRVRRRLEALTETRTSPGLPDRRDELSSLIENAPVPIGIIDAEGTIQYANEATLSFVKADDVAEVIGKSVLSFAASETAEATHRRFRSVIEDREPTPPMEQVFIDSEGERRTAIVSTTPITYQGEPAGQFVLNDITAYKRVQREIQREQDFTERLLNTLEDVFFVIDTDGQFRRWNDTLMAVTGLSDAELREHTISDIVHPDHHDRLSEMMDPDTVRAEPIEIAIQTETGASVLHEVRAVQTVDSQETPCVCGIARDVTDRKRRERELREFKLAVEHAGHAIFITDSDGHIEYVNPAFESLTGYSEREALGSTPRILRSGEHDKKYYVRLWETILDGETWDEKVINETKDGDLYHAEQTITPIVKDGTVTGFVAIQQDITALKEYEQELERRNDELERFARVVSHDLRSPLGVATGNIELATDTLDTDPETARDSLVTAADALGRMDRLIEDVLALARKGEVVSDPSPVSIESLARASFDHVSAGTEQLNIEGSATIEADQGRLRSLFENLFRNAVDHAGPDVAIRVGTISDGDGIEGFYVADDGPGIPSADREQVFESGYTTREDGNGLGLAIVDRIVDAHGWTITVIESADGGARFEIRTVDPHESPA